MKNRVKRERIKGGKIISVKENSNNIKKAKMNIHFRKRKSKLNLHKNVNMHEPAPIPKLIPVYHGGSDSFHLNNLAIINQIQ